MKSFCEKTKHKFRLPKRRKYSKVATISHDNLLLLKLIITNNVVHIDMFQAVIELTEGLTIKPKFVLTERRHFPSSFYFEFSVNSMRTHRNQMEASQFGQSTKSKIHSETFKLPEFCLYKQGFIYQRIRPALAVNDYAQRDLIII